MRRRNVSVPRACLGWTFVAIVIVTFAAHAAQPVIELQTNRSTLRAFAGMHRVSVKDPNVASVRALGLGALELVAKHVGTTELRVVTEKRELVFSVRVKPPPPSAQPCLDSTATCAWSYVRANQLTGAERVVTQCLATRPDDAECQRIKAVLCEFLDDDPRGCATREYERYLRMAPSSEAKVAGIKAALEAKQCLRPSAGCAQSYLNDEKLTGARYVLETCLEMTPADAECHALMVDHCAAWSGDERCVATEVEAALKGLPDDNPALPRVLLALARLQSRSKQYEQAKKTLKTCIAKDPTNAGCFKLLGATCSRLEDTKCAIANYSKFLELAPDDPDASTVRAMLKR